MSNCENRENLWQLVNAFDSHLTRNIRSLTERQVQRGFVDFEDIAPVVCRRKKTTESSADWSLRKPSYDECFVWKEMSTPTIWQDATCSFRKIIDSLFDDEADKNFLKYFSLLLRLDPAIVATTGMTFTFAAFDGSPERVEKDGLMNYALGRNSLPNTELLFSEGQRKPLAYWYSADQRKASALKDRFAHQLGGTNISVYLKAEGDNRRFWLPEEDLKTWENLVSGTSKKHLLADVNLAGKARNATFKAYWRHIVGSDDPKLIEAAQLHGCFGSLLIPVPRSETGGDAALILLFGSVDENELGVRSVNVRKAIGASLVIRGPFDTWQNGMREIKNAEEATKIALVDMFGHEVKALADALGDGWSIPFEEWERTRKHPLPTATLRVIEFPQLFRYSQRILRLWSMSCKPEELPRPITATLGGLIKLAFVRAVESRIVASTIDLRQSCEIAAMLAIPMEQHVSALKLTPEFDQFPLNLNRTISHESYARQYFGFFRIFVSLFEDFIKFHGKTNAECQVRVSSELQRLTITVVSPKKGEEFSSRSPTFNFGVKGEMMVRKLVSDFLNAPSRHATDSPTINSLDAQYDHLSDDNSFTETLSFRVPKWLEK